MAKAQDNEEYLKRLYEFLANSSQQFEKLSLYIASGAFTLSFTFIKEIINLEKATHKWLLTTAWGMFLFVIFIALCGHFISVLAMGYSIKNAALDPQEYNKKIKRWNIPIHFLNSLIIVGLLTASIFLISFINKNL